MSPTHAIRGPGPVPPPGRPEAVPPGRRAGPLEWLDRLTWRARQRDLERWLAGAADAADLEQRLRAAERGLFRRGY